MSNPVWTVRSVETKPDYRLIIKFEDGEIKEYDARPLLKKPIYKKLKDPAFFHKARVFC